MQFGAVNDAGASTTELDSSSSGETLLLTNSGATTGNALRAVNTNIANTAPLVALTNAANGNSLDIVHENASSSGIGVNVAYAGTGEGMKVQSTAPGTSGTTIHGRNDGSGDAVLGEVTGFEGGAGVVGFGINSGGVVGITTGSGPGVGGITTAGAPGAGVNAWGIDASNTSPALEAQHDGLGHAVYASIENAHNSHRAVYGRTVGTGAAILAGIANAASSAAALQSSTTGAGADAASAHGVGGKFTGKTAQARLVPAAATSHPTSGTAGDLFVDAAKRLWFCRGGTSWRQLA